MQITYANILDSFRLDEQGSAGYRVRPADWARRLPLRWRRRGPRSPATAIAGLLRRLRRRLVGDAAAFRADLSSTTGAEDLFTQVKEKFGRVDILINNAGTILRAAAEEVTLADWQQVLQVNLTSVFQLSQLAARDMIPRGGIGVNCGKIVNIASLLSFQGGIRVPAYAASKGGVAQLTKALANEWAPKGIQVNAIAPGYFRDDEHGGAAGGRDAQPADPRADSGSALGTAGGSRRGGAVSELAGEQLRYGHGPYRGWRVDGAVSSSVRRWSCIQGEENDHAAKSARSRCRISQQGRPCS